MARVCNLDGGTSEGFCGMHTTIGTWAEHAHGTSDTHFQQAISDRLVRKHCKCPRTHTYSHTQRADARFPVGKARLETIGVLGCACLMSVAAYAVVQDSLISLYEGLAKGEALAC